MGKTHRLPKKNEESEIRTTSELSQEELSVKAQWDTLLQSLKENDCDSRILWWAMSQLSALGQQTGSREPLEVKAVRLPPGYTASVSYLKQQRKIKQNL